MSKNMIIIFLLNNGSLEHMLRLDKFSTWEYWENVWFLSCLATFYTIFLPYIYTKCNDERRERFENPFIFILHLITR